MPEYKATPLRVLDQVMRMMFYKSDLILCVLDQEWWWWFIKKPVNPKNFFADFWQIWQFVVDEWWSWWLWRCWLVGQWPKGKIAKGENCQRGKLPYVYKKIIFSWRIGLASESCGWRMSPTDSTWRLSRCFPLFFLLLCFQCCPIDNLCFIVLLIIFQAVGSSYALARSLMGEGTWPIRQNQFCHNNSYFLNIIIMNMYHHLSHSHHLP